MTLLFFYYTFIRKKLDLFTFCYYSLLVYFLPGLLGYVIYPGKIKILLDNQVYYVYFIVITMLIIFTIFKNNIRNSTSLRYNFNESRYVAVILALTSNVIMLYYILTLGSNLLEPKDILMPKLGFLFLLFRYSLILSFIMGLLEKNKYVLVLSSISLAFSFIIGFRGPMILIGLATLVIYIKNKKNTKNFVSFRLLILGLFFCVIIINGKMFYGTIMTAGLWESIKVLFSIDILIESLYKLEPFYIQTILNEIVVSNYTLESSYLKGILYEFTLFPSLFIDETYSFNYHFQNTLFPSVEYGMAYNIWAEAYAINGLLMVLLFSMFFFIVVLILDYLFKVDNLMIRTIISLVSVYWIFMIHRYSVAVELTHLRHILFVVLYGLLLSIIFSIMFWRVGKK